LCLVCYPLRFTYCHTFIFKPKPSSLFRLVPNPFSILALIQLSLPWVLVPFCLLVSYLIIPFPQLVCDILLFCECLSDRLVPYLPCRRWRSLLYWPFPLTTPRVVSFSLDYPCLNMMSSDIGDVREIENL
jgi:hypothetical protein